MPAANVDQYALTEEQKQHWLEHGFIKLEGCFSREAAEKFTSSLWTRLGASPEDKSTWLLDKLNMPGHTAVPAKDFAPKAYYAIAELVGGEDRIADWCKLWKDGWIVNFGRPEYSPDDPLDLRKLDGWHSDGDWFRHYLDSPEQAMLIIPLFSDIESKGGATAICTDGIGLVAKELYKYPEGTKPSLAPWGSPDPPLGNSIWRRWVADPQLTRDESFHEAIGKVGDVYLLHPLMVHSASLNLRRAIRIITNPPVALKEPFNFNRADPRDYSLVEQKTLRELGRPEGLPDWRITGERQLLTTPRIKKQDELKVKEIERMSKAGVRVTELEIAVPLTTFHPS